MTTFLTLGAVFLIVTGGEALYADLGHFGASPIRRVWSLIVFAALVLNYPGQAVSLIYQPDVIRAPFFRLAPAWAAVPLGGLAGMAAVIASQAVISETFSLTRQAIRLVQLPRMRVTYTQAEVSGQVYLPFRLLVIALAGWFDCHQQAVIDYLIEGNRVLNDQLEGRRRWGIIRQWHKI